MQISPLPFLTLHSSKSSLFIKWGALISYELERKQVFVLLDPSRQWSQASRVTVLKTAILWTASPHSAHEPLALSSPGVLTNLLCWPWLALPFILLLHPLPLLLCN